MRSIITLFNSNEVTHLRESIYHMNMMESMYHWILGRANMKSVLTLSYWSFGIGDGVSKSWWN